MIFHSTIEPIYFILPLLGLLIGLFGTVLGGGGGFFFLPILTLLLRVPAQTAVITSLVATLPVCLVGSVGHYRKSQIDFQMAAMFGGAGIAGAFIGAGITSLMSARTLKVSFGIYSVLIGLSIAIGGWRTKSGGDAGQPPLGWRKVKGAVYGFFAGMTTGTFGTSGTASVLAGLLSMQMPLKTVIGTSMLIVLANAFFAVGAHFLVGQIDLTLVGFLTAGSAIGALIGPKLLANAKTDRSEGKFRYGYAAVMLALGVLMIIG